MPTLSSLFGQEAAVSALRKALEAEHLPGTYLFVGPSGVGKGALAQAFAQAVACLTPRHAPFDACGECESCRRMKTGTQPEIVTIYPAGEQMQIWQFWDRDNKPQGILSHTLNFAPSIGKRRVYILEQAETLNESAANSLLKVLEEPPPYALFVLLASHPARVLPTIVSRSQVVRLRPVPTEELAGFLRKRPDIDPARARMLAAYAEGRIGQAVKMAQDVRVGEEIGRMMDFAEQLADAPRVRALKIAEQMRKLAAQIKALIGEEPTSESDDGEGGTVKERAGRKQQAAVFDLLVAFYRDLLTLSAGSDASHAVNQDRIVKLKRLARSGTPERWMRCLDALLLARRRLDANANVALVTEVLAMTLVTP
jgi:DNA polymerase-3 subunit delta'